jgi:hypothetical protein
LFTEKFLPFQMKYLFHAAIIHIFMYLCKNFKEYICEILGRITQIKNIS